MKIAFGSDHFGFEHKKRIIDTFSNKGYEFIDVGTYDAMPVSYPGIAEKAVKLMIDGACDRVILICGTGIGMAISANKIKGAYAAVCHDSYSTERSILSNNGNIMCMGALVIGPKLMDNLVEQWLGLTFDKESTSFAKVAEIYRIESENYIDKTESDEIA